MHAPPHSRRLTLDAVTARRLDWIIICSFDRWGVADVDEFFEFRRLLLKNDVQLWSVVDQMNLTGLTEGDYFRIVAMAIGALVGWWVGVTVWRQLIRAELRVAYAQRAAAKAAEAAEAYA